MTDRLANLARKVAQAKWDSKPGLAEGEIAADAITGDLRTTNNTLSFWESELEGEPLCAMAALALAAGAERVDKVDVAWLDKASLSSRGIAFAATSGETPVADLRERHVDAVRLDARRLVLVAEELATTIRTHKRVRRFTVRETKRLLADAVRAKRLRLEDLKEGVRDSVDAELKSTG